MSRTPGHNMSETKARMTSTSGLKQALGFEKHPEARAIIEEEIRYRETHPRGDLWVVGGVA